MSVTNPSDAEYAFSAWKDFGPTREPAVAPAMNGTWVSYSFGLTALNAAGSAFGVFRPDPDDFDAGSRTTQVRLKAIAMVGGTAPGRDITVALSPVATWTTAGAAARAGVATLGAALTSVTFATASLTANSRTSLASTPATLASVDNYVISLAFSGATAANSNVEINTQLQYRQV